MTQHTAKDLMRNAFARRRAAFASSGALREELIAQAVGELDQAIAQARSDGAEGRADLLKALSLRAELALDAGDKIRSRALLDEVIALHRESGDQSALASAMLQLAALDMACGARASALDGYEDAISILREDESATPLELALAVSAKAEVLARTGDKSAARAAWFEAATIYAQIPDDEGVIRCQSKIAELALA